MTPATEVTVVRVYLSESEVDLPGLLERLQREKVRGVSVFRGIAGFGESGKMHMDRWIDLSLDLPVVVEFFDLPDRVAPVVEHLAPLIKPGHMLSWQARINL